ncbi:MAG: hypothetical protein A2979_01995 [Deltaproteobacteria bacterium RIFCSPLOWO2_01_FULL_45_74]|nr:MAG: hypothetical protein A2712_04945 [Deltaproteobacteria bacterium RIFCSPHIGHO2_01_FULL_43_49]OGQ15915.1 MAG: hypothetical protein A3D22_07600 [Deltaproteobacteria bacterium RIFCSPHIGHO2_02_FULL_44_53]OGQ30970.1 MAG: hypothetical protein A2979_01995 [Deltaproteobacteria bacterium RIFCSPLOWO2_01_FULL_45_74]OGQ43476.1 MAG: hypothetical protein A3I70_00150 [Deltaproteobacteria bacterium RIFCSPLOWO2_02_FULL_44_34]
MKMKMENRFVIARSLEETEGRRSNPVEQKPRQPPSGLSRLLHSHGGKKPAPPPLTLRRGHAFCIPIFAPFSRG